MTMRVTITVESFGEPFNLAGAYLRDRGTFQGVRDEIHGATVGHPVTIDVPEGQVLEVAAFRPYDKAVDG